MTTANELNSPRMHVGLFIPCYVDQLYPHVGMATVEVLERLGVTVDFPVEQTCCGQPMANTGCTEEARPLAERFLSIFAKYDHVVCPSGSCVAMVRHHYEEYLEGRPGFHELTHKTYEFCEFLNDVLRVERIGGRFPQKVGLHQACHGLRELRLATSSELVSQSTNKVRRLLETIDGLEIVSLERPDECCGFGGTFAVSEEAVSVRMGQDRVRDHETAGAEIIASADMSCLMHMDGLIRRTKKKLMVMHVAEILAEALREKSFADARPTAAPNS